MAACEDSSGLRVRADESVSTIKEIYCQYYCIYIHRQLERLVAMYNSPHLNARDGQKCFINIVACPLLWVATWCTHINVARNDVLARLVVVLVYIIGGTCK